MAGAQRQIRNYGGVVTRLNVYKDFRKFFESQRTGVYGGELCSKGAPDDLEQVSAADYDIGSAMRIRQQPQGQVWRAMHYYHIPAVILLHQLLCHDCCWIILCFSTMSDHQCRNGCAACCCYIQLP